MGRECMRDEQLKRVLDQIDISECEEIIEDYIFYCEKAIRLRCSMGMVVFIILPIETNS